MSILVGVLFMLLSLVAIFFAYATLEPLSEELPREIDAPLARMLMCVECDAIVPADQRTCPSCLCSTFIPIGRIDAVEQPKREHVWRAA